MAMGRITYGAVTTPRVYIDNLLFARTIGVKFNLGDIIGNGVNSDTYYYHQGDNGTTSFEAKRLLWDMDPVRYLNLGHISDSTSLESISTDFEMGGDDHADYDLFLNLMHTSNYAAVLNHNLHTGGNAPVQVQLTYNGGQVLDDTSPIVGNFNEDVDSDGFILAGINLSDEDDYLHEVDFKIIPGDTNATLPQYFTYDIGCFSIGTYLDFPFAPDLEVSIGYSHEGVQTRKTIGGKDLTHVSYSGSPDWGKLPPFTISDGAASSYRGTGLTGRKSWNIKFSYIDKTDMFRAMESGSSAGSYFRALSYGNEAIATGFHEDTSILGTYLSRTLGGKLKHIFQPDSTKAEFYMVKLDQTSTTIKQITSGAYEIGLKFVQVW